MRSQKTAKVELSVSLDFGAQFATTAQRHLEIEVRADTGLNCTNTTGFTLLSPRQQITAVPTATHANSAFALDAADGSPTSAVFVDNAGSVGVGTTAPLAGLHVKKEAVPPGGTLALEGTTHTYLTFFPDGVAAGRKGYFGFASATTNDITIGNEAPAGRIVLATTSGAFYAMAGDENLRTVRGVINADGSIMAGSGFSVGHPTMGYYDITFSVPFAGIPAVTGSSTADQIVGVNTVNANHVVILVFESSSGPTTNAIVHFIATGPR